MYPKVPIISLMLLSINLPADAQSSSNIMKEFGLVGTWSEDCAMPGALRITYTYSLSGNPTFAMAARNDRDAPEQYILRQFPRRKLRGERFR